MGLILLGLFTLALALIAIAAWSVTASLRKDRQATALHAAQDQEQRAREAQEARLHQPGEKLRCLSCGRKILGPLPDTGCPDCHLSALVVLDEETDDENWR